MKTPKQTNFRLPSPIKNISAPPPALTPSLHPSLKGDLDVFNCVSPRAPGDISEGSKPSPVFRPPTSSTPIKNKTPTIQKQAGRRQQGVTNLVANFQSVKNKIPTLSTTITVDNPDIIYGTETWLHEQIHDSELLLGGFTIYRNDRSGDNNSKEGGGGVLLAI